MDPDPSRLQPVQRALLERWLPNAQVVADLSWGLTTTTVLEVISHHDRFIVKAGGLGDGNIVRELRAHREWLGPWVDTGRAPSLVAGDADAKLLVTRYLSGPLVQGTAAQDDPETYRQAGEVLAEFHRQVSFVDEQWNDKLRARVQRHLGQPHRIEPELVKQIQREVSGWPCGGARVVPTHGDWQPRNWLMHDGRLAAIDFGRTDLRPPIDDLVRLSRQDFARDYALEVAFLEGYGSDPREPEEWRRAVLGEAVGTAVWAYGVGDEGFENVGHHQLAVLYT